MGEKKLIEFDLGGRRVKGVLVEENVDTVRCVPLCEPRKAWKKAKSGKVIKRHKSKHGVTFL